MYDYYSDIRFNVARYIEQLTNTALSKVLGSESLEQLNIDNLGLAELIHFIENEFKVKIPNELKLVSLESLVDYIYKRKITLSWVGK